LYAKVHVHVAVADIQMYVAKSSGVAGHIHVAAAKAGAGDRHHDLADQNHAAQHCTEQKECEHGHCSFRINRLDWS
jgi:hypothetical protein